MSAMNRLNYDVTNNASIGASQEALRLIRKYRQIMTDNPDGMLVELDQDEASHEANIDYEMTSMQESMKSRSYL